MKSLLCSELEMASGAVRDWMNLPDENEMLNEWPNLLQKCGLVRIAAWRNQGNQNKPALVHVLAQRGKLRALEFVVRAGLSPDAQRGDGCTPLSKCMRA